MRAEDETAISEIIGDGKHRPPRYGWTYSSVVRELAGRGIHVTPDDVWTVRLKRATRGSTYWKNLMRLWQRDKAWREKRSSSKLISERLRFPNEPLHPETPEEAAWISTLTCMICGFMCCQCPTITGQTDEQTRQGDTEKRN